jgi:adenylyltransferase/sulfurtransferase
MFGFSEKVVEEGGESRYSRQVVLPAIGHEGQEKLRSARVVVVGVGALGSVMAELLARAGVGTLRLIDRDYLELHNLQRQSLYTEADVREGLPKAVAAARHIEAINSDVAVEPCVADLTPENALDLLAPSDARGPALMLVLDGTDNLQTRYLLNDLSIELGVPWVYSAVIGTSGVVMPVVPGDTACLRCLFPDPPPAGSVETCDVAGVLGSAAHAIASIAVAEAIKLLVGGRPNATQGILTADLWAGTWDRIEVPRNPLCPACGQHRLDFLRGEAWGRDAARLCGRDAVQVRLSNVESEVGVDLTALGERLRAGGVGDMLVGDYLIRLRPRDDDGRHELTIFPDGRVIVKGTQDVVQARSLVARYIGM